MKEAELLARLNSVIGRWIRIPSVRGYGGTGAPGRVLEELLGVRTGNLDIPDAGQWELKFLSGTSLLTLFHLEAEPKGHLHNLIRRCSWPDLNGRASFRHTVRRPRYGHSRYGLHIESEDGRISLRQGREVMAYWTDDRLLASFVSKLRRLLIVAGTRDRDEVRFDSAWAYEAPRVAEFARMIYEGIVEVDFDVRRIRCGALRNHGTKFRIRAENLNHIYARRRYFTGYGPPPGSR